MAVTGNPASTDRICSAHFLSGKKSDDKLHPDYVPSIRMTGDYTAVSTTQLSSLGRHDRHAAREAHRRESTLAGQIKEEEENRKRRYVVTEHNYTTRGACTQSIEPAQKRAKLDPQHIPLPVSQGKALLTCI